MLQQLKPPHDHNPCDTILYGDQQVLVKFIPNHHHHQETMESENSGACSPPPLWQNSPSPSKPLLEQPNYWSVLRPSNPRAEAIVRAQWELMEMVKNMPESSYELTLKDMVEEHEKIMGSQTREREVEDKPSLSDNNSKESLQEIRGVVKVIKKEEVSKKNEKAKHVRSASFESKGMFLNMVVPFSMELSKKKKKVVSNRYSGMVVSERPDEGAALVKNGGGERDWWKKKFGGGSSGSTDSSSSRISNISLRSWSTLSSSAASSGGDSYVTAPTRKKKGILKACYKCSNPEKQTIE